MLWLQPQVLNDLLEVFDEPITISPFIISIRGADGMGKGELVNHILKKLPPRDFLVQRIDFNYESYSSTELVARSLSYFQQNNASEFKSFLNTFSPRVEEYISNIISLLPRNAGERKDWFEEIFFWIQRSF